MVTTPVAPGQPHPNGTLVDERTYAPFHQHFLVARLDMDIDGSGNTVFMTESHAEPRRPGESARAVPRRPRRAVAHREPGQAERQLRDAAHLEGGQHQRGQRSWHPSVVQIGSDRRYSADVRPRVTCRRARRRDRSYSMGDPQPPRRALAGRRIREPVETRHGLGRWTLANRSIENTDVVLWYVFGIHHITRPEDWPVMPIDAVSFWLKPFGFFDRNPALDVVATPPDMCHTPSTSAHH